MFTIRISFFTDGLCTLVNIPVEEIVASQGNNVSERQSVAFDIMLESRAGNVISWIAKLDAVSTWLLGINRSAPPTQDSENGH